MNFDLISFSIGCLVGQITTAIVIFGTLIIRMIGDKE